MSRFKHPLATLCVVFTLGTAPMTATGGGAAVRHRGGGAGQRADPCAEEHPPGHAFGRRRRCASRGSSSGVARGDFNGDGVADLAVGVPGESVAGAGEAGAVNVIHGSAGGLTADGNQFWTPDSVGIPDPRNASTYGGFGSVLTAWNFGRDEVRLVGTPPFQVQETVRTADLVVGVPYHDIVSNSDAGAVQVLYGSSRGGLTATGGQFWTQDSPGVLDAAEQGDLFGSALY